RCANANGDGSQTSQLRPWPARRPCSEFLSFLLSTPGMVYLSRIYTKTGDQGDTALGDGSRVAKDHSRVAAYGSVDELNAVLGLLLSQSPQAAESDLLRSIQNDLFDVGADLCLPQAPDEKAGAHLRVSAAQCERLEQAIDRLNAGLAPLTSFILPGG